MTNAVEHVPKRRYFRPATVDFMGFDLDEFMSGWSCNMEVKPFKRPKRPAFFSSEKKEVLEMRLADREKEKSEAEAGRANKVATAVHHCL